MLYIRETVIDGKSSYSVVDHEGIGCLYGVQRIVGIIQTDMNEDEFIAQVSKDYVLGHLEGIKSTVQKHKKALADMFDEACECREFIDKRMRELQG